MEFNVIRKPVAVLVNVLLAAVDIVAPPSVRPDFLAKTAAYAVVAVKTALVVMLEPENVFVNRVGMGINVSNTVVKDSLVVNVQKDATVKTATATQLPVSVTVILVLPVRIARKNVKTGDGAEIVSRFANVETDNVTQLTDPVSVLLALQEKIVKRWIFYDNDSDGSENKGLKKLGLKI